MAYTSGPARPSRKALGHYAYRGGGRAGEPTDSATDEVGGRPTSPRTAPHMVEGKPTKFRPVCSPSRAPPPRPARRARPHRPRGARVSRPPISLPVSPQTAAPASPCSHPHLEDGAVYHLTPTEYELPPRAIGQRRSGAEPHLASETGLGHWPGGGGALPAALPLQHDTQRRVHGHLGLYRGMNRGIMAHRPQSHE